jgi:hypothetical protein
MPFLMAVQARHVIHQNGKIGPAPLRELLGSVQTHGFNAGLLVTNTSFTPDALWLAQQRAFLLRLGDIDDCFVSQPPSCLPSTGAAERTSAGRPAIDHHRLDICQPVYKLYPVSSLK